MCWLEFQSRFANKGFPRWVHSPHSQLGNDFHLTWVFRVEPEGIWAVLCHGTWCWGHWGFGHVQVLWHQLSLHGAWADERLFRQPQLHTFPGEGEEGSVYHWQGVCHPNCHWWVFLDNTCQYVWELWLMLQNSQTFACSNSSVTASCNFDRVPSFAIWMFTIMWLYQQRQGLICYSQCSDDSLFAVLICVQSAIILTLNKNGASMAGYQSVICCMCPIW